MTRAGWLVRIQKGFYQVATDLGARGTLTLSSYAIAQVLLPGSYVSFASALQFHGLYDPLLQTTASVALKQRASVNLHGFGYRFVKTGAPYFFGFEEHRLAGHPARIATVEKALLDWVQFSRSAYRAVPVLEILGEYSHAIELCTPERTICCAPTCLRSAVTSPRPQTLSGINPKINPH